MPNVLVISTSDSIRSQMVRAYLQYFARKRANIYSAGLNAGKYNALVKRVMAEDGLDVSSQTTNTLSDYDLLNFDYIVTVCNLAKHNCPYLPSAGLKVHQHIDSFLNQNASEEEKLKELRLIRQDARVFAHKFSKIHFKGLRP